MSSTEFSEGQQAFRTGNSENPYATDTDEHGDWTQGYQDQWYTWLDEAESADWQEYLLETYE